MTCCNSHEEECKRQCQPTPCEEDPCKRQSTCCPIQENPRKRQRCCPTEENKQEEKEDDDELRDFMQSFVKPQDSTNFIPPQDSLFSDIGFPEAIGLEPFVTQTPTLEDIISSNDAYEEDAEIWFVKPEPPPPTPPIEVQLQMTSTITRTAEQTASEMISTMTSISQAVGSVTSQDPDGVGWLTPTQWANSTWDGIPFDTDGKTKEEICAFLRPDNVWTIRGLRERFYEVNPFADNENPTVTEIDNWNIEVIRHFRALLGNTIPVENDARLYLECRWADERKYTEAWDTDYPDTFTCTGATTCIGKSPGPCFLLGVPTDIAGGHCGAGFFPLDQTHRNVYINAPAYNGDFISYPELDGYTNRRSQAEGLSGANADVPWCLKLPYVIANWICSEGLSGHPGPYVSPTNARQTFGCSWWYDADGPHGPATGGFRGKWR